MKKENLAPHELTTSQKSNLKTRIISAIVGIIVVLPCLFLGEWFFFGLIALMVILSGYEIVHCAKKHYNPLLYIVTIILIAIITFMPILFSFSNGDAKAENFRIYFCFSTIKVSAVAIIVGALLLFFLVTIDKNFEVRDAAYIFTFGVIVGLGLQCALIMRYLPQYAIYKVEIPPPNDALFDFLTSSTLIIYIILGCLLTDAGAYFVGIFFGKNKINERISPKKTWEGAIGGTIFSFAITFAFGMILAANNLPMLSCFTLDKWYNIAIISFVLPIIAQLGDFIFSSVKRYYGIKDFGFIMPGHGGVLDRIDSVIFGLLFASIFVIIFYHAPNADWWRAII